MSSIAVERSAVNAPARGRAKTPFYLALSLFMAALVLIGFWPSYYGALLRARPAVIHVHGAVFTGWMVLLVAQVVLAWRGRVQMHRRVGRWGIAYGVLVLIMGVVVGIAAPVMHVNAGEWTRERGAGFLLVTMGDMVLFGSLFGAAIVYRRKPEIHKRLMLAATVALLFAAVGRMEYLGLSQAVQVLIWLSPLFIGMVYDWRTRGVPHVANVISTVWLFVGACRLLLTESAAWQRIGQAMLGVF